MKKKISIIGGGLAVAALTAATLFPRTSTRALDSTRETYAAEVDANGIVQRVIVIKYDWDAAKCKAHLKTVRDMVVTQNLPGIGWKYDGQNFAPIAPLVITGKDTLNK